MAQLLDPVSPGEILLEDFLGPLGITPNQLAREIGVPAKRVAGIIDGTGRITGDTAQRLGQYFRTSAEMWLSLQSQYDLRIARRAPSDATVAAITQLDVGKGKRSTASTSDVFDRAAHGRIRKER